MKGKLEQPDLGISTKEYLELVLHNKKVTRRSVNALANHPIPLSPQVPLGRKHSINSNKDKTKSPKDFAHSGTKTRSHRNYSEDQVPIAESAELLNIQTKQEPSQTSTQQTPRSNRHPQHQKAPKPFKFQDVTLEVAKPIRLFSFEQMGPQVRNEFALGPNLLKHRHVKIVQREVLENMEKFMFYNAFITKRNKNDFSQISIEYFDDKLNQNPDLSTVLNLENQKDRSFILTQDIGLVELDEAGFDMLFGRVDPGELTYDIMKSKNNLVYWPVVVMNNCAVDSKTREFLTMEADDDCDYLREFFIDGLEHHHFPLLKMEEVHDRITIKKEDLSIFGDDQESNGGQALGKEDLLRVREELKEIFTDEDDDDEEGNMEEEKNENSQGQGVVKRKKKGRQGDKDNVFGSDGGDSESLRSLEEELKKENNDGKRMFDQLEKITPKKTPEKGRHDVKKEEDGGDDSDNSVVFADLPLHKKVKHEYDHVKREKIEEEVFEHNVGNELDEEGAAMIWFVGTGYYQLRKVYDIKPLNNENKAHLMAISKKTKFLNKMLHHFSKIIKNYNTSTGDSDYSLPISNKVMKENLLRVIYLGTEDKGLVPMVPLTIKEKKNENFTILRVLDDYSLLMIKNNESKTVVKSSSFLPPLEPLIIERLDNLAIYHNYNKEVFTKKVLFPAIYPKNLIDVNYNSLRVAHKRTNAHKQIMATEDPTITRNIRCKQCKYILGDLPYHKCNKCDEYFHDHCVEEKKPLTPDLQKNGAKAAEKKHSNNWLCKNCKNCSYCIGNSNREQLLFCINCDEVYHTFCIQALHHNYRIDNEFKASRFICTECALCQMCGCEINNFSDKNIVEEGLTLCNDCMEVRLKKEYCPICNRRWDYLQHAASKEEIEMIECQCKMWVHRNCDSELSKDMFKEFAITGRVYHCPDCRKTFKNKQLVEFINVLMDLDEHKYFTIPVDEKSAPNYRQVITFPMDFETMTKKAMDNHYLEDPYTQLKADFDLICNNAMIYNMPKSQVFGIAKKLKKFGDKAFQFFKELIDCPDREFLKFSRKLTPNHYISQFKKEIDEYYLDILFEENEMNPLTRIRVIDNTKNHNFNNSTSNSRKTYNKEVIIEITGLNHLLAERTARDDKRALENRSRYDHSDRKAQANLEEFDAMTEYDSRRIDNAPAFEEEVKNQMAWSKLITREGVALIEELLSQNSKNKPFFYFNPVVIQFTNPGMVKQDICYLCGSFDECASYLFCSVCQEGYHYYCISKSYNDMAKFDRLKASANWQCPKCKLCQQCHKKSESHDCLICETCDNLYHINCIYPQIGVLFPSEWRCEECFHCSRCGSNKLFSDNLSVESGNIQPEFCEDFKWCYECGLKMAYFKFCKICKKYCQKSISSSKNDNRSLQYINPVEDSVECSVCRFKYHISCYEEEYYALNSYDDFVCYNCKIDDEEVTKIETELEDKAEKIITKRKIVKHLLRVCESIFNQYLTLQHAKSESFKENLSKMIFDYIIDDYEFLTRETHIKSMLENYKLLNTATKLIGTKYVPPIAHSTSTRNENAMVVEKLQDSEHLDVSFLNYACDLFDFLSRIPIMYSDTLEPYHELACLIALKDKQTEVLPTETSREYYDYKGFIKLRDDELSCYMLLPLDLIYDENVPMQNYSMASDLMLTSALCLKQEQKASIVEQLEKPEPRLLKKTIQLVTLNTLLQENNSQYFEHLNEHEALSLDEKLGGMVDHVAEIVWAPYWKTLEDMRMTLYLRSILDNMERPGALVAREGLDQEIFEILFYRDNIKLPVSIAGNLDPERVNPFGLNDASTSSAKRQNEEMRYYEELKNLMFTEMIAIEVIKRRMKAWFEMKKENNHSGRNRSGSTKMIKAPEKIQHNGLIAALDGANHMVVEQTNSNHSFSSKMVTEEPENSGVKGSATKPNKMSEEVDVDVVEGDTLLESPMSNTECICCKLTGDRKLSGRLLFVDCDQWVHTNCALWSYDVFENIEGGLVNFIIAYRRSLATVCSYCNKSGATIFCFSKKCQHKYHFQCSFLAKCSFLTCKKFYCKNCSLTKNLSNKVNTDFSTYRRLYIVRNQTLFYMESTKNSRYIKEKPLEMQSGAFNRVGNLTVISAKKYNSDLKFLISEYAVTKIITQNHERKPIFITLNLQDTLYYFKFSRIDDSVLLNKKSLYAQKMSQEGEENWKVLETAENFFENLATFLGNTPATAGHKDKISKKELLGEFLALYSFDVRRWLKSSIMIDEEEASEKKEYPSFKEYYYSHKIDEMDAFSREEKVKEIYGKIIPKIQTLVQNFNTKDEAERLKNPKERSFNRMTKRIKTNKRKTESLGHFGFGADADGAEEIMPENHFAVPIDNAKYTKIQSTELENKLKADYWPHKKKPIKVLVAPSPIHKYGLFALENFNKNEIVIEYCGEVIRNKIADLRENQYKQQGFGDCFMFRADKDAVIDATFKGNQARYLNHSCNPNCSSTIIEIDGEPKIMMYANRPIYAGEELTYDYQFDVEAEKIECTCGAKNCQGRLN